MNDVMEVTKSFEYSGLLTKGATRTIENETKEKRYGFLGMLLSTVRVNLLRSMLASKSLIRAEVGKVRSVESF